MAFFHDLVFSFLWFSVALVVFRIFDGFYIFLFFYLMICFVDLVFLGALMVSVGLMGSCLLVDFLFYLFFFVALMSFCWFDGFYAVIFFVDLRGFLSLDDILLALCFLLFKWVVFALMSWWFGGILYIWWFIYFDVFRWLHFYVACCLVDLMGGFVALIFFVDSVLFVIWWFYVRFVLLI